MKEQDVGTDATIQLASPEFAAKGSQRWLQVAVAERRELVDRELIAALSLSPSAEIRWVSPIRETEFTEYRDQPFLDALKVETPKRTLASFWPRRGAKWDGLAATSSGQVLLIEAKAHIPELLSSCAASPDSLAKITRALEETRNAVARHTSSPWTEMFYQYTNRLAHLYFLRELNGVDAHMVYIYFTNAVDVFGPNTREEWNGAIKLMKAYLGLQRNKLSPYVHSVFIDVRDLPQAVHANPEDANS